MRIHITSSLIRYRVCVIGELTWSYLTTPFSFSSSFLLFYVCIYPVLLSILCQYLIQNSFNVILLFSYTSLLSSSSSFCFSSSSLHIVSRNFMCFRFVLSMSLFSIIIMSGLSDLLITFRTYKITSAKVN